MWKDWTLKGLQAGTVCALILTLWNVLAAMEPLDHLEEASGFFFVLITFGILGLPILLYATALGFIAGLWHHTSVRWTHASDPPPRLTALLAAHPEADRRLAALLLSAPLGCGLVAGLVGLTHLGVTAGFQRASFAAIGLGAVAALGMAAWVALWPLALGALERALGTLPSSAQGKLTKATLAAGLALMLLGVAGVHLYIAGLNIWGATTLWMVDFFLVAPLLGLLVLSRVEVKRLALKVGIPLAALILGLVCFVGAWGWSSQNASMRMAMDQRHSALTGVVATGLQRFGDKDGDGVAGQMGGADCDDTDATVYPGAKDLPQNGLDEDCDGTDAQAPGLTGHPALRGVARALQTARRQAKRADGQSTPGAQTLPPPPKNLIFILVDTLRPDHLGFHGYTRQTSSNLDALAKDSSVFLEAYATAPHTPRSIPSIFFSRYASHMKWRGAQYNYPKATPENVGLFEVMQEQGWKNYGISSHFYFEPKRGLGQGFESWDNEGAGTIAESNLDTAAPRIWGRLEPKLDALAAQNEPFGLFVHFFEPHAKWISHEGFDFGQGETPAERHINNYDSEIAYVDDYLGKVIAHLKKTGLYDSSILVVTSDHGEAFGDHGLFFHGQNLYNEVLRVPLIIRIPGWPPRRIEGPVSLVDIAPTLLDLWGLTPPADFEGYSLVDALSEGAPVPLRPVISELLPYTSWKEHHVSMVYGDEKYIKVLTKGTQMYFNLRDDPKEQKDLVRADEASAKAMRERLEGWIRAEN